MSDKITDHVAQALANLVSPFSDTPLVRELVSIFVNRLQLVENVAHDVLTKRVLPGGEGVLLDILGKILGEKRGSLSDAQYTKVLLVVAAIHQSDATGPEVIDLASELLGVDVWYRQRGRKGMSIEYDTTDPVYGSGDWETRVARLLWELREATAELEVVEGDISGDPAGVPFTLDTDGAGLDEGELCGRIL